MTRDSGWMFNREYTDTGIWAIANVCFGIDGKNWSKNHQGHHRVNLLYDSDPQNNTCRGSSTKRARSSTSASAAARSRPSTAGGSGTST